ncbi:MAG: WD40 repeat domain-containing protein [Candidatus Obscuribacterales bacterium]|nr:WD40 repeat domain-containing protein [Candidatus Obscuribacterales bacterium]
MNRIVMVGDPAFGKASYARQGGLVAMSTEPHKSVCVLTDPLGEGEVLKTPCVGRVGQTLIRSFFVGDERLRVQHELLFTRGFGPLVYRHNVTTGQDRPPLHTEVSEVTCLQESVDGRYIAVGGSKGRIEVWSLDQAQPQMVYRSAACDNGMVAALCFNRTNMELFAALSDGELQHHEPLRREVRTMESALRWPVYTIASCKHTKGIAFGGDGSRVWFLNVPCQADKSYLHTSPFRLSPRKMYTGPEFMVVDAIPNAGVSHLDTGVGPMIHQLHFVTDTELLVVGDNNAQLWNLDEVECIEEASFPGTLAGAGVHEGECYLAVRS